MISATYHCPQHDAFSMTLYSDKAPCYLNCPTCGIPSRVRTVLNPDKYYDEQTQELKPVTPSNDKLTLEDIRIMKDQLISKSIDPIDLPAWISYKFSWTMGNTPQQEQEKQESAEKKRQVHEAVEREAMRRAMEEFESSCNSEQDLL